MESRLIKFYRGTEKDTANRTIFDIWEFSDEQLEMNHDFIQWLFPLTEKSNFNDRAPILSREDIHLFSSDKELSAHVLISFKTMMHFYGYETAGDENCKLIPSPNFLVRTNSWISPGNHNFLRITRILKFLVLINQYQLASCFFVALSELYASRNKIIGNSFQFWQSAMQK